jgi:hypothetical protein
VEAYRLLEVRLELDPEGEALLARLRHTFRAPPARLNLVGPPGSGKSLLLDRFLEDPPFPAVVLERMGPETPLRVTLLEAVEKAFGSPEVLLAQAGLPPKLETAWRYSLGLLPRPSWSREALEGAILEAWRRVLLSLKAPLLLVLKDLHAPDLTLERLLLHPFPNLLLLLESRRPLFSPHLGLKRGEAALRLVPAETQRAWHLEAAGLLRAQLLLEAGEKVEHLLGFTPSLPLTLAWKAALLGEKPEGLQGYGMLGRWVRRLWRSRGKIWTRSRW